jgi:hypothetical protein
VKRVEVAKRYEAAKMSKVVRMSEAAKTSEIVRMFEAANTSEAMKTSAARKTFEALKMLEAVKTMYALKIAKTWGQASLRQTRHRLLNQWPSRWFPRSRETDTSAFGLAYWNLSCKPPTCLISVSIS